MGNGPGAQNGLTAPMQPVSQHGEAGGLDAAVALACARYYWKPMMALTAAVELSAFDRAGVQLGNLAGDLGCGDGTFASLLCDLGVTDRFSVGVEYDPACAEKARSSGAFDQVISGDMCSLKLESSSLSGIVANQSLQYLGAEQFRQALREARRLLGENGVLVCTVPTNNFKRFLIVPRLMAGAGAMKLAARYRRWQRRRCGHRRAFSVPDWIREIESAGFRVAYHAGYFDQAQTRWWDILSLPPFRVFGLLKHLPGRSLRELFGRCARWPVAYLVRDGGTTADAAYVLIVARKADPARRG